MMPIYTHSQSYAVALLKKLRSVRHDQMHWLIEHEFPESKVSAVTEMRRLTHLGKAVNDGTYYYWPGCALDAFIIASLDIMRRVSRGIVPVFDLATLPCKLVFIVIYGDKCQAFRIYFPNEGEELECSAIAEAEQIPQGHAAIFCIQNRSQIPLLQIDRPHIFVRTDENGMYEYINDKA